MCMKNLSIKRQRVRHKVSQRVALRFLASFVFCVLLSFYFIGHRASVLLHQQETRGASYESGWLKCCNHFGDCPRKRPGCDDEEVRQHQRHQRPQLSEFTVDETTIHNGDYITRILLGEELFAYNNTQHSRLKFRPGSLQMSSAESLQYCYVNITHYSGHFDKLLSVQVSMSVTHKLIYRNIPKSSSSTSVHFMQDVFKGKDERITHNKLKDYVRNQHYSLVSFIREPLQRFYSSYDEAYFRMGPWMGEGPLVAEKPRLQQIYRGNKHKVDPYPYLYEGLTTLDDFRHLHCPGEVLEQQGYQGCIDVETIDNGTLAHRFEQFVRDYDGRNPFDVHLKMQAAFLVFNAKSNGDPLPITNLYNASEADKGWLAIAQEKGVEAPDDGEVKIGRKISRRFNVELVSDATKRRICRLLALDYCCLNLELPEVCRRSVADGEIVFCSVERRGMQHNQNSFINNYAQQSDKRYIIQPWENLNDIDTA